METIMSPSLTLMSAVQPAPAIACSLAPVVSAKDFYLAHDSSLVVGCVSCREGVCCQMPLWQGGGHFNEDDNIDEEDDDNDHNNNNNKNYNNNENHNDDGDNEDNKDKGNLVF